MKSEFEKEQFEYAYPDGIEEDYWNRARNYIIYRSLSASKATGEKIIEIGCGRGGVVKYLNSKKVDCTGVELAECRPHIGAEKFIKTGTDALALDDKLRKEFQVLLLFDVIEHLEDPEAFLKNILDKYQNLQSIVITVPARKEIWSNYDEFYGHYRRYDLEMSRAVMNSLDFDVVDNRYFFHGLYIAAKLLLKIKKHKETKLTAPKGVMKIFHVFISWYFILEYHLLPKKWKGSSIICVAKRK